ncbi:activating transcription factor 7-interacting protein 1 isoform X1 [Tribolium castaneum]|uniref:activating transcription factor 7-interacting protein 1 isoform X1 n=1 Tax=Tribolium castaneum TaxID=7070 RepID=UPI00046C03CD|nr:PREDICTED: activating transcription factor 7-interacting protein 1 isoform X1 [Tribolium castaneum]XP_015833840.1 PREDICTED: activating transcription factor 7-interacting protein 1 isoform X1 [Tribolium castaneum]XP_015833841.1 PREDICTED: activating transcription factor 7-interacting protein 1 isoform X1 [Tribolium castaneum]|eukprot:XP_015833839.1 PREDICTED: activating transcription factor 7-interacting protein 1 isoform X1 [Tribolium castaneum]
MNETADSAYDKFDKWCKENDMHEITEQVVLSYFKLQRNKYKASTVHSIFLMLKDALSLHKGVDISQYSRLQALLKSVPRNRKLFALAFDDLKSHSLYERRYQHFENWRKENKMYDVTEEVVLAYFELQRNKYKASTLWSNFSILRQCLSVDKEIDISQYTRLQALLKSASEGYSPRKSNALEEEDVWKFLQEADDTWYLAMKVILIMGYYGACRRDELTNMLIDDVEFRGESIVVSVPKIKKITKSVRMFSITDQFCVNKIKKYVALRPSDVTHKRFFLTYRNGYCVKSPIGVNTMGIIPKEIAAFLKLPNPDRYTGHCFKRTSATHLTNRFNNMLLVKRFDNGNPEVFQDQSDSTEETSSDLNLPGCSGMCNTNSYFTVSSSNFYKDIIVQEFQDKKDENETEEEILNKFGSSTAPVEHIDAQMEEQLLNDEEDEKKVNHHVSKEADKVERVNGFGSEETSSVEEGVKTADAPDSGKNTNSPSQNLEEQPTSVVDESGAIGTPCSKDSVKEIEADKLAAQVNGLIDSLEDKEQNCESKNKDPVTKNNDNPPAVDEAKCDNSRNSPKLQNEDSEDLFDISIIRDAEEDNAESAYNEAQAEESHEDSDEKAEDEVTNEKAAEEMEEVEEMDIDRQELNDVEIEEANLKETSDGESENKTETINSEEKLCDNVVVGDKSANECMLDEITGKLTNGEGAEMETDKDTEDGQKRRSLKRASSAEDEHSLAKKSRTDPLGDIESKVEEEPKEKPPLRKLLSLAEFMKTRKNGRKPTMHDLEEFCVQKICEAIVHKSDLGDVHHQLKVQEQLIETMRKEILQLTKQARDLEIVNKKLMNDLKQHNATQKPLSPLKITRSVGLQVKFTPVSSFEANKRRQVNPQPTQNQKIAPLQPATNRSPRAAPAPVQTNANRQCTFLLVSQASPQKPQQQAQVAKPSGATALLSQALQQNRRVSDAAPKTPPAIRSKPPETKQGGPSASVIDLTDEDDKNKSNKMGAQKNISVPLRTTPMRVNAQPQGIRLATSQGKVTPMSSVVTSSAPQLMYVVQSAPQNVLNTTLGQKAVVVNFQSANGVITSTLNGSAVSVIPKQANTIQLKPVSTAKPISSAKVVSPKPIKMSNKHPAPLPQPPVIRVSCDKSLKPIPPKPHLTIRKTDTGIILQWKMPYDLDMYEVIASYQLYAYQETSATPSTDMWRKVGDVKALALPMACTLTQFADKNKYYFAVRPVDIHKRIGMFSDPEEISL